MAEAVAWRSPLAALGRDRFEAPGGAVLLEDRSQVAKLLLRGKPDHPDFLQAAEHALGCALPLEPNRTAAAGGVTVLWTQPDEWLVIAASEAGLFDTLRAAGLFVAEVSDSRAALRLSGPRAVDLLRKGTSLDVHPRRFLPGHCAQTALAQAGVLIHRSGDAPAYDILCERSFAEYLWLWLEDAAMEYGGEEKGLRTAL